MHVHIIHVSHPIIHTHARTHAHTHTHTCRHSILNCSGLNIFHYQYKHEHIYTDKHAIQIDNLR